MKTKLKICPKCNDKIKILGYPSHFKYCKGINKNIQHRVILKENYYDCPKCKDSISKYCFTRHLRTCKGIFHNRRKDPNKKIKYSGLQVKEKIICDKCKKEFSLKGFKTHYWRSHTKQGKKFNPNSGYINGTREIWNKGLTSKTDERVKKINDKLKDGYKSGRLISKLKGKKLSKKTKRKISISMQLAVKEGRQKTPKPGGICDTFKIKNLFNEEQHIQGSWEKKAVEFFNNNKINWERNNKGFKYKFEKIERTYFPDFYLKDLDIFVEVKGYETKKDKAKWKYFPLKLIILRKKEIESLNINLFSLKK